MTNPLYPNRLLAAEVLACAIHELFPTAQLLSGGATDVGFYYDFYLEQKLNEQVLPLIETTFKSISKENREVKLQEMMRENGADFLRHHKQPLAAALAETNPHNTISIIGIGNFYDFIDTRSSLPSSTENIGAVKLLSLTDKVATLPDFDEFPIVRIEAALFPDPYDLKQFLKKYGKYKKQNQIQLLKELNLAIEQDNSYTWLPRGLEFKARLHHVWEKIAKVLNYQRVKTPPILRTKREQPLAIEIDDHLYSTFSSIAERHATLYSAVEKTGDELPIRYAEYGEKISLVPERNLEGMILARSFETDGFSCFCREEQVAPELISSLQFFDKIVNIIGFECRWVLVSLRDPHSSSTLTKWNQAIQWLTQSAETIGLTWEQDNLKESRSGPKLELRLFDPLGRQWTGPEVSIDLQHPLQLRLSYKGTDGQKKIPFLIKGSLFGSFERFGALLLEHFKGELPLWLVPEQVRILPIGKRQQERGDTLRLQMEERGFRVGLDVSDEKLGGKIHVAELEKVPYLVIIGEREEKEGLITLRSCRGGELQNRVDPEQFIEQLQKEIKSELASIETIFRAGKLQRGELEQVES